MEFYEHFLILVPLVVIIVSVLFFCLFMKETSYDEVLAKQKKDLKLPSTKVDKKKIDKKKNKKKETQNGNLHESDSEPAIRDFDLGDALSSEEEHVVPAPVIPTENTPNVRERKKKDKKQPKPVVEEPVNKEVNGTKVPVKKPEPIPVTKQPTPPPPPPPETTGSKKKQGQKKQKNGRDDSPVTPEPKTEQVVPSKKQEAVIPLAEVKPQESGSGKKTASKKKQKVECAPALVDEPLIQPTVYIPLMDNSEPVVVEKKEVVNFQKPVVTEVVQKSGGKKGKNVTDKENAEVKFKDFLSTMKNLIFSDNEAMSVVEMLKERSSSVKELVNKANKGDSAALLRLQEKDKLLSAAKDDAAVLKEQFRQLSQELVTEKQKSNMVEAKARERISLLEKEHGVLQSKIHSGYQEAQNMQVKFQKVHDQLESQITHLKQENGILRDAVSSATNQMESKQSNELNKLRQDYARLVKELNDKNSCLAQEEMQKKNHEQTAAGLKTQMQDAERRWEEVESYLRKRMSDLEMGQQDLQAKLMSKEAEVQSLHSKLTDTIVTNQQMEQRILQLMDERPDDGLQMQMQDLRKQNEALNLQIQKYHSQIQAQSSASVIVEELQKKFVEKEMEVKKMEESFVLERANYANNGEELKDLRKQNESLNVQLQNYIAQIQTQASASVIAKQLQKTIEEKDKEIKQVKDAVALEQANFANSGEELKTLQRENISLKAELQKIQSTKSEQSAAAKMLEQMEKSIVEKDGKIKALEERLQFELVKVINTIEEHKALQNINNELQSQLKRLQEQPQDQANKEVLAQMEKSLQEKDEKLKTVEELLETGLIQVANKEEDLRLLRDENASLRMDLQNFKAQHNDQVAFTSSVVEDLKNAIQEKDGKIKSLEELLQAGQLKADKEGRTVQELTKEIEALKESLASSQLEKAEQVSTTAQVRALQNELRSKEENLKGIEERFNEREKVILEKERQIEDLQKESQQLKIHIEEVQQNLQQQGSSSPGEQELQRLVQQHNEKIKGMEAALSEREANLTVTTQELKGLKKENEILKIQACELQKKHDEQLRQVSSVAKGEELIEAIAAKDKKITELLAELEDQKSAVEQQRKKNNERPQNTGENEAREILQKIFPTVSVASTLRHCEWIQEFEKAAKVCLHESGGAEKVKELEQKLKEGEEIHTLLQLECEKYKSVLAETEGILQRLQRSVEEEEGRWKVKLEESQNELREAKSSVHLLEQELDRVKGRSQERENLFKEKEHLETELEKAENERATYVSEVRELKTQLNETLQKLEGEQTERQKVANDLHEAQKSLDLIQLEILKGTSDPNVIENSDISPATDEQQKKEKISSSLSQTVTQLQQCLQQLTKGREHFQVIG
ncbi:kinectin isoform X10 [Engystomops pustulosus]